MRYVPIDGINYAVPFRELVRAHTPAEWADLEEAIRADGILSPIQTYHSERHGRALIDGLGRALIGEAMGIEIPILPRRVSDERAGQMARRLNFARRHHTPDEVAAMKQGVFVRVVAGRKAGDSLRVIAEREQVPLATVQRIVDTAGVSPDTPAITGADGKSYPAAIATSPPRVPLPKRAAKLAFSLVGLVGKLWVGKTVGPHLRNTAASYGVPFAADGSWPAADAVAATLRDVAKPRVSV